VRAALAIEPSTGTRSRDELAAINATVLFGRCGFPAADHELSFGKACWHHDVEVHCPVDGQLNH